MSAALAYEQATFEQTQSEVEATTLTESTQRHLHLGVQIRHLTLSAERTQDYREPVTSTARSLAQAAALGAWGLLLSADNMDRLNAGNGVDVKMPAPGLFGDLRLNFRSGDDSAAAWPIAHGWSLGGSFEQTQILEGSGTRSGIAFVPQLVLDLAEFTPAPDRLNLCLQYANWHNADGHATEDAQPQLLMRWSF